MNIDKLLEKKGKTRYWLARQINVTDQTLVRLANNKGERISISTIYKLVEVLECSFDDLFKKD